eukprot:2613750-Alexandrium_andersonii.AAC.1
MWERGPEGCAPIHPLCSKRVARTSPSCGAVAACSRARCWSPTTCSSLGLQRSSGDCRASGLRRSLRAAR